MTALAMYMFTDPINNETEAPHVALDPAQAYARTFSANGTAVTEAFYCAAGGIVTSHTYDPTTKTTTQAAPLGFDTAALARASVLLDQLLAAIDAALAAPIPSKYTFAADDLREWAAGKRPIPTEGLWASNTVGVEEFSNGVHTTEDIRRVAYLILAAYDLSCHPALWNSAVRWARLAGIDF